MSIDNGYIIFHDHGVIGQVILKYIYVDNLVNVFTLAIDEDIYWFDIIYECWFFLLVDHITIYC